MYHGVCLYQLRDSDDWKLMDDMAGDKCAKCGGDLWIVGVREEDGLYQETYRCERYPECKYIKCVARVRV